MRSSSPSLRITDMSPLLMSCGKKAGMAGEERKKDWVRECSGVRECSVGRRAGAEQGWRCEGEQQHCPIRVMLPSMMQRSLWHWQHSLTTHL
jgi:hypothetical protein